MGYGEPKFCRSGVVHLASFFSALQEAAQKLFDDRSETMARFC
jgi:hypothetical protein